jgi:NAD(P)H dehydrogenase (quinone)
MKHLLIVCHPSRQSFTQTMARAYAKSIEALGHTTAVRDLYRAGFDPVLTEAELIGASKTVVPAPIRAEQRRIAEADVIALFYPLWWAFMPAMLKGYLDRVLTAGFAYDLATESPLLTGKQAVVFTSSAGDMAYLRTTGVWRALRAIERDEMLFCGIDLIEHVHFPAITPERPLQTVAKAVRRVEATVQRLWGGGKGAADKK